MLTISLFNADTLSGAVTDETEIECDSEPGDDRGEDEHGDDDGEHGDGQHGDDAGDDEGDDDRSLASRGDDEGNEDFGTEALVPGAKVLEAELKVSGGAATWTEVELLTP